MANPQPILTRKTVIFAELEQETDTVASWNAGTRTITLNGGSWLSTADSQIGKEVIVYDGVPSSASGASANVRTVIQDNTDTSTKTIQLLEAPSFTPASSDVVVVPDYARSTVDPSATATNAILCTLPELTFNGELLARDYTRKSLTHIQSRMGNRSINIAFSVEIKGAGGGGGSALPTLNKLDPLLKACGFGRVDNPSGSNYNRVYTPSSEGFESCCIDVFADGLKYTLRGCVGNATFKLAQGQIPMIDFEFSALYADATDVAIPSATYSTEQPKVVTRAELSVGSSTDVPASSVEFGLNSEISEYLNMSMQSASPSHERFMITSRAPSGTFNPQAVLTGDEAWVAAWAAGDTLGEIKVYVGLNSSGTVQAGETIEFKMPTKSQASSITLGDDGGIRRHDIGFNIATALADGGDNDLTITMY